MYVSLVLLCSASLKMISALKQNSFVISHDPLLSFLSKRELWLLVAVIECATLLVLAKARSMATKLIAIGWLSGTFATYRFSLWLIGYGGPCACFGELPDWIGVGQHFGNMVSLVILLTTLTGSCALFLIERCFEAPK